MRVDEGTVSPPRELLEPFIDVLHGPLPPAVLQHEVVHRVAVVNALGGQPDAYYRAEKNSYLMHIGFSLLVLWGNKNGLPSIKVKKCEIFQNKRGSSDFKWSSLNAQGAENPLTYLILELGEIPF